jgi:hypothetical protein
MHRGRENNPHHNRAGLTFTIGSCHRAVMDASRIFVITSQSLDLLAASPCVCVCSEWLSRLGRVTEDHRESAHGDGVAGCALHVGMIEVRHGRALSTTRGARRVSRSRSLGPTRGNREGRCSSRDCTAVAQTGMPEPSWSGAASRRLCRYKRQRQRHQEKTLNVSSTSWHPQRLHPPAASGPGGPCAAGGGVTWDAQPCPSEGCRVGGGGRRS